VHVQEAHALGNARIVGTRFEDVLMAQAARRVIVTAERIVDGTAFAATPELVAIPGFLVEAVVEAPRGASTTASTRKPGIATSSGVAANAVPSTIRSAVTITRRAACAISTSSNRVPTIRALPSAWASWTW